MTSRDETERNRVTITAAFAAWRDNGAPIADVFDPEMSWRIEGHSAAWGAYSSAWFIQMRDGEVIVGTAFYDSIAFNELWAQVTPAAPSDPQ
jgi:ketosteroid isomerase-like protein